jgi:hypothetical protein
VSGPGAVLRAADEAALEAAGTRQAAGPYGMARKSDLGLVDAIARKYGVDRFMFKDYIHQCKGG